MSRIAWGVWMCGTISWFIIWVGVSVIASVIGAAARHTDIGNAALCSFVGASVVYGCWTLVVTATLLYLDGRIDSNFVMYPVTYIIALGCLAWFQQPLGSYIVHASTALKTFQESAIGTFICIAFALYVTAIVYCVVDAIAYIRNRRANQSLELEEGDESTTTVWIVVEQPDETLFIARGL